MKLTSIAELNWRKAKQRVDPLLLVMPKYKQKHSKRVGKTLKDVGAGKIATYSGLLHDYLERGGSLETLTAHINELGLPDKIVHIVKALSSDEKESFQDENRGTSNLPLEHLANELDKISDPDLRNIIVITKLADRIDKIKKRLRDNKLSQTYRKKTDDLVAYLISQYTGKGKPFKKLMRMYAELMV